ncbi:MAG: hypothetical protein ACMUJM_07400 [bacterium]
MRNFSVILIIIVCYTAFPAWAEKQGKEEEVQIAKVIEIDREKNSLTIQVVGKEEIQKIEMSHEWAWPERLEKGSIIKIWRGKINEMEKIEVLKGSERFFNDPTGVRSRLRRGAGKRRTGGAKGHRRR